MYRRDFIHSVAAAGGLALLTPRLTLAALTQPDQQKISIPGSYRGFSDPVADGFRRTSRYIEMSDGVRIAVDVLFPTLSQKDLTQTFPVVMICTGYRRAFRLSESDARIYKKRNPYNKPGDVISLATRNVRFTDNGQAEWIGEVASLEINERADWMGIHGKAEEHLLLHGYAVVVVDTRSTGASFGLQSQMTSQVIGRDLAELCAWFSGQSWCNGNVGMLGASWHGAVQHMASTYGAKNLKAMMPQVAPFDQYLGLYPGGNYNIGLMGDWIALRQQTDKQTFALPVDEDSEGKMLAEALKQRQASQQAAGVDLAPEELIKLQSTLTYDQFAASQGLVNWSFADGSRGDVERLPLDFDKASAHGIPTYCWGGWWDIYASETPIIHRNLGVPGKLTMGPWNHGNYWDVVEAHRWFDYWLKDIDNGIMDEPSVTYASARSNGTPIWRHAANWPPKDAIHREYWLQPDGLATTSSGSGKSVIQLNTDYSVSAGPGARPWGFSLDARLDYSELEDALTDSVFLSTSAFANGIELSCFPELHLQISTTGSAGSVFAWLFEVTPSGDYFNLSEGQLNFVYRKLATPGYDNSDLPHHSFRAEDKLAALPGEIMSLAIPMTPISAILGPKSRLGLLLSAADSHNSYQAQLNEPPQLSIFTGAKDGSRLKISTIDHQTESILPGAFDQMPVASRHGVKGFNPQLSEK